MCGISGIITLTDRPVPLTAALRMHQALAHRGPDGEGIVLFPFEGEPQRVRGNEIHGQSNSCWAVLAHQRLSIIDMSPAGQQPMRSHHRRWWISFNGEIFNFIELKELVSGLTLMSNTDTEVLLQLWEQEGEKCLTSLLGMWAFALLSPQRRELILCRDRFGIKPLYYAIVSDWLLFASEIRALLASGLVKKAWSREAVQYYFAYGVPVAGGKFTFYDGIFQVPPATLLRCYRGTVTEKAYYSLPEQQQAYSLKDLGEEARSIFIDSVRIALRSDAPMALTLSGGLDSTTIAAAVMRWPASKEQVTAYTLDPSPLYESELEFAAEVAKKNVLQLRVVSLSTQLTVEEVADFVLTQEEPIGSPGSIVQYLLYRQIAREGVRVILDGQGGDEVFAGYPWLYYPILCEAVRQRRYRELLIWLNGVLHNGNASPITLWLSGRQFRNPYLRYDHEMAMLLRSNRSLHAQHNNVLLRASSACTWRDRQRIALYVWELPLLLRDADRNGMKWGLEVRPPFLDHRLVELTHNADPLLITHKGWSKYIERLIIEDDHIPSYIRWFRRKRGFYIQPNAFATTVMTLLPLLIPFSKELPEIINVAKLREKLLSKGLLPHQAWKIFVLLILDVSPDLVRLDSEVRGILQNAPDFYLGRDRRSYVHILKRVMAQFGKWLRAEMLWTLRRGSIW